MNQHYSDLLCPLCGTSGPKVRYSFDSCNIVRCISCSMMWLYPPLTLDDLHEVYDENYYANQDFLKGNNNQLYGYSDYLAERINKQYGYKKIVATVKQLLHPVSNEARSKLQWLDVGCGLGFLLDVAFDHGFGVTGVEFNDAAVAYIRSKYTYPVISGLLSDINSGEKYNVISMFDVVEHLPDPLNDLRKLRKMICDDGVLIIQTMDSDSFMSRLFGKRLEDFRRIREHLFFFSRSSITQALNQTGWDVTSIVSIGHTFQTSFLLDRLKLISPLISNVLRAMVYPRFLLDANIYVNPGTKMLVFARPK